MSSFITIAKITKPHGVRGEVSALLLTDFPERFESVERVLLHSSELESWETLEAYRFHKDRVLLKFQGMDSRDAVAHLAGCEVRLPEAERVELPDDTFFDDQLEGCRVLEGDSTLGHVDRVFRAGGGSVNLVVVLEDGREVMLPFVKNFIVRVDLKERAIFVNLPEGLLDTASRP